MKILNLIKDISDPRMVEKVRHNLSTIIFVSLCGVLCGCESWNDIRDYCKAKQEWLSQYVKFIHGVPSTRIFTV